MKLLSKKSEDRIFYFDYIFTEKSSQVMNLIDFFVFIAKKIEIFEKVAKPIVQCVLEGQNGTILAYGQVIYLF